jgi:hypothetical protein
MKISNYDSRTIMLLLALIAVFEIVRPAPVRRNTRRRHPMTAGANGSAARRVPGLLFQ